MASVNAIASIKPQDGAVLPAGELMERIIAVGDVSQLSPGDRAHYLVRVAESSGLNPLTRPFDLIPGQGGKIVLYANKGCTDQLRKIYGLQSRLVSQETIDGVRVVTVEVTDGTRSEANIGAVSIDGLKGDGLANALMKAITKAKRRATLDWCGLGILDETEIEGLQAAARERGSIEADHRAAQRPTRISATLVPPSPEPTDQDITVEASTTTNDNAPPSALEQARLDVWAQAKSLGYSWDAFNVLRRHLEIKPALDKMTASQVRMLRERLDEIQAQDEAAEGSQDDGEALDAEHVVWEESS